MKNNKNNTMNKQLVKILSLLLCLIVLPLSAFSLGLGNIQVQSYLSQPLRAVISLTGVGNTALGNIKVHLAPKAAYVNAGIDFPKDMPPLILTPQKNKHSQWVVLVTTKKPLSQPIVSFMLQLSWPQGEVYREYTLLLNPPIVDVKAVLPIGQNSLQSQIVNMSTRKMHVAAPPAQTSNTLSPKQPLVSVIAAIPTLPPRPYGPIKEGGNLYDIAFETLPSESVTTEQNMVAIFLGNLQAFGNANMNALMIGKILALPALSQIQAVSTEAAQTIIEQQDRQWDEIQKDPGNPQFQASTYSFLPNIAFNPSSITQIPAALTSMQNAAPLALTVKHSSVPNIEGQFVQNNGSRPKLALAITMLTQLEEQQKLLQMRLQEALTVNQSLTKELGKRDRQIVSLAAGKVSSDMPLKIISTNNKETHLQQRSSVSSENISFSEITQWLDWIVFIVFLISVIAILTLLLQLKRAQTSLITKQSKIEPHLENTNL